MPALRECLMRKLLVASVAMGLFGCSNAPFWEKHKREDAEIARKEKVREKEHETWVAEERRRLLALCLDIAKFEKQWNNFVDWSFDRSSGDCTVSYKKPPTDMKTEKECADEILTVPSERDGDSPSVTAPKWTRTMFYNCTSAHFTREWSVRPKVPLIQ